MSNRLKSSFCGLVTIGFLPRLEERSPKKYTKKDSPMEYAPFRRLEGTVWTLSSLVATPRPIYPVHRSSSPSSPC